MHASSYSTMARAAKTYLDRAKALKVLDVGSCNVNGTYRALFEVPGWTYSGLDILVGPNVDIVVDAGYEWAGVPDGAYDVVVCGQVMEHVTEPWMLACAIGRVCRKHGFGFVIAPHTHGLHRFPVDCWRVFPDGMEHVMTKHGGFEMLECDMSGEDTYFFGRKA